MRTHRRLVNRCTSSVFTAAVLVTACLVLTACGTDGPTEPVPPEPPPPAPVPTRIAVTPSSVPLDAIGQTAELTAQVFDQYNAPMSSAVVTWTSGDVTVATVSAAGQVTSEGNGSTVVTAQSGSASASVDVTVMQSARSIAIEPQMVTFEAIGETVQLTATVLDGNDQPIADAAVSWTSSDTDVATVDDEGLITAVSNGSARITARSGSVSASVNLSVMQAAHSIVIEPQMATLTATGETVHLTATVLDGNEHPVTGVAVSWTSSDTDVAAVDDEGMVTALSSGAVLITASYGDLSTTAQIEVEIASSDRDVLVALYNALGGLNWSNNANWLSDSPLYAWYGVETDEDGRVTRLDLGFNNLSGSIPPEVGNLSNLQVLDLHENEQMSCVIPPELGSLTNLRRLHIFSIPILPAIFPPGWDPDPNPLCTIPPELGNLVNLEELVLSYRSLSGRIPAELGNLTNLQSLDLGFNGLSGSIPPELGSLSNLIALNLGYNSLSGSIPPALGNLANLQELHLDLNELSGSVPLELGKLSELTNLALAGNEHLSGPLPDEIFSLGNLQSLSTFLTGLCVPPDIDPADLAWLEMILFGPLVYCEAM